MSRGLARCASRAYGAPASAIRQHGDPETLQDAVQLRPQIGDRLLAQGSPCGERDGIARTVEQRNRVELVVMARRVEHAIDTAGVAMDGRCPSLRDSVVVAAGDALIDPETCEPVVRQIRQTQAPCHASDRRVLLVEPCGRDGESTRAWVALRRKDFEEAAIEARPEVTDAEAPVWRIEPSRPRAAEIGRLGILTSSQPEQQRIRRDFDERQGPVTAARRRGWPLPGASGWSPSARGYEPISPMRGASWRIRSTSPGEPERSMSKGVRPPRNGASVRKKDAFAQAEAVGSRARISAKCRSTPCSPCSGESENWKAG